VLDLLTSESTVLVLFGLGVGILVGTTGMGGGSIMTPLLILVLGVKPTVAIGTDLAYAAVTKTVGGWRHWRQGTVDLPIAFYLGIGSIPAALGGVWVLEIMKRRLGDDLDQVVIALIAAALLFTAVAVSWRAIFHSEEQRRERETIDMQPRHKIAAVVVGVVVGFVLGVTSAGSGALIAVALILLFRLTPHRVVGTDVFHAAVLLWVAAIAHLAAGNVDLVMAGTIMIGSVPGVWIGSNLAMRLPPAGLRPLLGMVLLGAGTALLTKAGVDLSPLWIVIPPIILGIVAWIMHRRVLMHAREGTG
jgi:uncharacterized membrane protein YfcA